MYPRTKVGEAFYANCWIVAIWIFLKRFLTSRRIRGFVFSTRTNRWLPHMMVIGHSGKRIVHLKEIIKGQKLAPIWLKGRVEVFTKTMLSDQDIYVIGKL